MGILQESDDKSKYKLHKIAPGVWGRSIPPEEQVLKPETVERLAASADSEGKHFFAQWIRDLYKPYLPKIK